MQTASGAAQELSESLSELVNCAAYVLLTDVNPSPEQCRELDLTAQRIVTVVGSNASIQGPPDVDFARVLAVVTRLRASVADSSHAGLEEFCRDLLNALGFPVPDRDPRP